MLYKSLNADRKSCIDDMSGVPSEVWVVDEWHEITGPLRWDPNMNVPRNGLFCSDDILQCMGGEFGITKNTRLLKWWMSFTSSSLPRHLVCFRFSRI